MALFKFSIMGFLNYTGPYLEYKYADLSIYVKNGNDWSEIIQIQEYIYIPSLIFALIVGLTAEFKGGRFFFAIVGIIYLVQAHALNFVLPSNINGEKVVIPLDWTASNNFMNEKSNI